MSEDEARKQTENETSDDLELTDDTSGGVVGGRDAGAPSLGEFVISKPIDKPTP